MKTQKILSYTKQSLFLLAIALIISACTNQTDSAKYSNPENNKFLKTWMLLGPIYVGDTSATPSAEIQKAAFEKDLIDPTTLTSLESLSAIEINEQSYGWKLHTSESDIVNLNTIYEDKDFAYAFAFTEIEMAEAKTVLYGLGSDDAVKLWLNGKEVHKFYGGRALAKDDDLVELQLKKGSNQLLLKIQDFEYGWEFCFRPIGTEMVSELFCKYAASGDLDNINFLLNYNPDLSHKATNGLTALQNAKVKGRNEVVNLLTEKGAKEDQAYPELSTFVDKYILENLEEGTPGLAVLVAKDGEVLFKKGYGYANIENKTVVNTETKFRIGSVTKQFIAVAILKLQEAGKLNVQDKLSKFVPEFPRGDEVTIHHLLTHTSGIYSFTSRPGFTDSVTNKVEAKALMDSIMSWEYNFDPGEEMMYNNSGYFILGEIIEIVSGKWYGDYLKDEIFDPLNMKNSGVYINETPPDHEAKGYTVEEGEYMLALDWNMSWAGGAGSLYSTVEDLFIWNEALFNGKVLSKESLKAAHTPTKLNNGEVAKAMSYGYGWGINNARGKEVIAHSGGLHGFISYLARVPDENLTVVALTNTTPTMDGLMPGQIATDFGEYAIWEKLDPQKSYSTKAVDPAKLNDYIGRYDYGNSMVMVVTVEDNKLFAKLTDQPKFELFADGDDVFFWKVVEANIKFIRNEAGDITYGIHSQGGQEMEVAKLPELETLPITKSEVEVYLGKYEFQDDFFMNLTFDQENRFFLKASNQTGHELFKTAKNFYQAKDIMLSVKLLPISDKATIEFEQGVYKSVMVKMED